MAVVKKKPPTPIRPDDAMARFDRLLATMAPRTEAKRANAPRAAKRRGPKPRKPRA